MPGRGTPEAGVRLGQVSPRRCPAAEGRDHSRQGQRDSGGAEEPGQLPLPGLGSRKPGPCKGQGTGMVAALALEASGTFWNGEGRSRLCTGP